MGFFDSLISGVEDVAGFVMQHSDQIRSVVSTIAKVAGAIVADDDSDVTPQSLNGSISDAMGNLQIAANNKLKSMTENLGKPLIIQQSNYNGFWRETVIDPEGVSPQTQYSDLASVMTLNGIGLSYTETDGTGTDDVVDILNKGAFCNPPSPADSSGIITVPCTWKSSDGRHTILLAHSYANIPLYADQTSTAILSSLAFSTDLLATDPNANPQTLIPKNPMVLTGWTTTILTTWSTAIGLSAMTILLYNSLTTNNPGWTTSTTTVGVNVTFTTISGTTCPAIVRQAVETVAKSRLTSDSQFKNVRRKTAQGVDDTTLSLLSTRVITTSYIG